MPSGPVVPALHLQSVSALLPARELAFGLHPTHVLAVIAAVAVEYFPSTHERHSVFARDSLYVPGAHGRHASLIALRMYPGWHSHAALPAGALEFATHAVQLVAPVLEYVCAGHSTHPLFPATLLCSPATHAMHDRPSRCTFVYPALQVQWVAAGLPSAECDCTGQFSHKSRPVAPVTSEYVSTGQLLHTASPTALYVPAAQREHVETPSPVHPALHAHLLLPAGASDSVAQSMHAELSSLPVAALYLPPTQSAHELFPACTLYFPGTHRVQPPPSGPVAPALHVQAVGALLAAGASAYGGHAVHTESPVAPTSAEYEPEPHAVHSASPVSALCVPATHGEHDAPSGPVAPALHMQM